MYHSNSNFSDEKNAARKACTVKFFCTKTGCVCHISIIVSNLCTEASQFTDKKISS